MNESIKLKGMQAIQLRGEVPADDIKMNIKSHIQNVQAKKQRLPKLVMVLVGDHFASLVYVRNKAEACEKIGMASQVIRLPDTCSESNLLQLIHKLNCDETVDGILVQLPLPETICVDNVLDFIDPLKDVDGFHPINIGLLAQGRPHMRACTPYGIIRLLQTLPITLKGMHAVVVGASNIVGKPMMLELLKAECTVTICHIATRNLRHHVAQADILISAIGKREVIQGHWIQKGAIIIDAGINKTEKGMTGDIDFETAAQNAYAITPVPGGVGPMTVATLLENTWKSYQSRMNRLNDSTQKTTA